VTALCCNGADVISGSDGGCLKRWSIDTGKCLAEAQGALGVAEVMWCLPGEF